MYPTEECEVGYSELFETSRRLGFARNPFLRESFAL